MKEVIYPYRKNKIYVRFAILINALLIVLIAFLTLKEWNVVSISLYVLSIFIVIVYMMMKIKQMKRLDYFIKWDAKGVYTYEAFRFCAWKHIKSISLQRYLGYQTLFFEIDEDLDTKINPIHKQGKQWYCLPLADCKGNTQEILNQLIESKNCNMK